MSCCGGGLSAMQVQARGRALVDNAAARGALTKLVYVGEDVRNRAYVAEGKPYFFGANKRVNAVPARVVPQFLDQAGRYYGPFVAFDPAVHLESSDPLSVISDQRSVTTNPDVTPALDLGQPGDERATDVDEAPAKKKGGK